MPSRPARDRTKWETSDSNSTHMGSVESSGLRIRPGATFSMFFLFSPCSMQVQGAGIAGGRLLVANGGLELVLKPMVWWGQQALSIDFSKF